MLVSFIHRVSVELTCDNILTLFASYIKISLSFLNFAFISLQVLQDDFVNFELHDYDVK